MDWVNEVHKKWKRKNQILFSKESDFLQDLILVINKQNHQALVLWAFDLAEETVKKLEATYPNETRPRTALETAKFWAHGKVKMPIAKREILNCHAFAKEISSLEDIALCHAVGQACSVVHTTGHSIGFPIYDLTAIVRKYGIDNCREAIEKRKQEYIEKLLYWSEHYKDHTEEWANFMLK